MTSATSSIEQTMGQLQSLDIHVALERLASDPHMGPLVGAYGQIHHPATRDPFRDLARAIVSQQLSNKVATAIWARLESSFAGQKICPHQMAHKSHQDLKSLGLSNAKASYVQDLATLFREGALSNESLLNISDEDVCKLLQGARGIGPWTIDMFLIFGLNRPDVLPTGDLGVKKAMAKLFGLSGLPHSSQMVELAEPWRPWRTVASWYLWRSLEGPA